MSRKVFISSAAQSEESIFMCSYWWLQTIFSAWCFDIWSWIYVYIYIYTHTYIHTVLGHFSYVRLCVTLWTHQAPLSIGFSRQEHWSGLPCPPPGDLPDSGIKPASFMSPALPGDRFFTIRATWEAYIYIYIYMFVEGCFVHYRMFNSIFNFYLWDTGSYPLASFVRTKNISRYCQISPNKMFLTEKHCFREI